MKQRLSVLLMLPLIWLYASPICFAQQDTLRVMTYNVLHYGDGCQGTNSYLHSNLKTIIQYANPDVVGLVKVQSIKLNSADTYGLSPIGFADSILSNAFNMAYPSRYSYGMLMNASHSPDDDMDILFYDKNKLGFISVTNLCTIEEDFNLYKLFYKDPYLNTTHDSTFLYIVLNHTKSGNSTDERDQQDSIVVQGLKNVFSKLPNLINMGDFNTHTSDEPGYQLITATSDTNFLFYDPPFNPDNLLSYPLDWGNNNNLCAQYLNTSTRSTSTPNNCGTSGGAKNWYIHVFLSKPVTTNSDFIKYIPNSYTTIGNDGQRVGVSINNNSNATNTSVPSNVLTSLFNLSDKYPVMIKLGITYNAGLTGAASPLNSKPSFIKITNPVNDKIVITFSQNLSNQKAEILWSELSGKLIRSEELNVNSNKINMSTSFLIPGTYLLTIKISQNDYTKLVIKQ